jgi:hypothetical protein
VRGDGTPKAQNLSGPDQLQPCQHATAQHSVNRIKLILAPFLDFYSHFIASLQAQWPSWPLLEGSPTFGWLTTVPHSSAVKVICGEALLHILHRVSAVNQEMCNVARQLRAGRHPQPLVKCLAGPELRVAAAVGPWCSPQPAVVSRTTTMAPYPSQPPPGISRYICPVRPVFNFTAHHIVSNKGRKDIAIPCQCTAKD